MWADDPEKGRSWLGPWSNLIHCDRCHALISSLECTKCGRNFHTEEQWQIAMIDGKEHRVPAMVFQGALSYTTHSLLTLMKREWDRPLADVPEFERAYGGRPSQRMLIIVLFWTLFEHHMDRLLDAGLASVSEPIRADLMRRYATIGSRMDRLYRLAFGTKMQDDLITLGYGDVFTHLSKVQRLRNEFVHGNSQAIDDTLVSETVARLPDVQAAWLALYNYRCTGNPSATPVWGGFKHD